MNESAERFNRPLHEEPPIRKDDPIVGWPEWLITAFLYALVIVQLYVQFSKPLSATRGVDEGQAARACHCLQETP